MAAQKPASGAPAGTATGALPLPPGRTGLAGFAVLKRLGQDPLGLLAEQTARYGDVFRIGVAGPMAPTMAMHPAAAEHVLARNHRNYRKGLLNQQFKVLDGEGLIASEGEYWVRQRRLAQPAFHRQRIHALGSTMTAAIESMAERWSGYARSGETFDVEPELMHLTLRIAGKTLFGVVLEDSAGEVSVAVDVAREYITFRFYNPMAPLWLPTPLTRRFHQAKATLDRVVFEIIAERRREGKDTGDLLSMLMLARDEVTGESMTDLQLRDEVMTLLMAGHETTAVAMTWVCYLLATQSEARMRLWEELERVLGGRTPTVADLPNLPWTRAFIDETLRLYPPAWAASRQAIGEDELCGYQIPPGSYVTLGIYFIQRHLQFWDEPDRFNPERFLGDRSTDRHRYAYLPFGGGPRGCIGNQFALLEAQLALATLAQRFHLELKPGYRLALEPKLSLRPRDGLPVVAQERTARH